MEEKEEEEKEVVEEENEEEEEISVQSGPAHRLSSPRGYLDKRYELNLHIAAMRGSNIAAMAALSSPRGYLDTLSLLISLAPGPLTSRDDN